MKLFAGRLAGGELSGFADGAGCGAPDSGGKTAVSFAAQGSGPAACRFRGAKPLGAGRLKSQNAVLITDMP